MREINLNRQKLGLEDLLFGVGIVTQIRAGQSVNVTKINAGNLPFDETQSLFEWAQSINIEALGSMATELQAIYDNLTAIGNVEDNLTVINTLEDNLVALQSLYTNISKLQNIDTNMSKLQNIDTNMSKLQNIDTNMSKLQAIYTDLTKLESIYDNLTMLLAIYNNLTALNNINSKVIPNLTELLLVNDNAAQVAADKLTVATDKGIVSGYKEDVSAMKVAVETIYDTFDDRFLGVKTSDPLLDNDGNILQDGAMYFNTSSNALKVYDLGNTLWVTIPQIYLSGLLDVQLTSITTGDILTWNGSKWVNTRTPSFDSVKLNGGTSTAGTATWNNTEYTYDLVLNPNVTLQVGQEELVYCKNNTASLIANGRPVMAVGTNGNSGNILVDLHDGTKVNARRIIGIATEDLAANGYGFVTRNGKVRGINTTGSLYGETWVNGDILYVKATGALTKVEPVDTSLKMPIAFVIHAHTNGTLYVRTTGIDENHDRDFINDLVNIHSKTAKTTPVDADEIMIADSTSSWSLKKISWASIKTAFTNLFTPRVATTTNKAIARYSSTTGDLQNSAITIDDSGNIGSGTQSFNGFGGSGFKNYIINGNFDIWEYGITQESSVDGINGYGSDNRWLNQYNSSYRKHTRQLATDAERLLFNVPYFSRTTVVTAGNANSLAIKKQHIEDVTRLAGKTVTLSFWAKADSNKNIAIEVVQVFGTGGSPSAILDKQCVTTIPLTSIWQKKTITFTIPSIIGKTLGTDGVHTSYTQIRFWLDAGSTFNANTNSLGTQSGTFDIAQVQLEEGSVATPFEQRPYGLELSLCQRYYEVVNTSFITSYAISGNNLGGLVKFKATKRVQPTLLIVGDAFLHANVNVGESYQIGISPDSFVEYRIMQASAGAMQYSTRFTVDAELKE